MEEVVHISLPVYPLMVRFICSALLNGCKHAILDLVVKNTLMTYWTYSKNGSNLVHSASNFGLGSRLKC